MEDWNWLVLLWLGSIVTLKTVLSQGAKVMIKQSVNIWRRTTTLSNVAKL